LALKARFSSGAGLIRSMGAMLDPRLKRAFSALFMWRFEFLGRCPRLQIDAAPLAHLSVESALLQRISSRCAKFFRARESRELTWILGEVSCCQSFAKWRIEFFASYSRLFACFAGAILLNRPRHPWSSSS